MKAIPFSGIRKMMERAHELERQGKPIIHLEIGEPDFDTPSHIKRAAASSLEAGMVHYTSNYGIPELRSAIAEKLRRDNQLEYDPGSEIIVTVGANEAVFLAVMAVVNPGDEVLVPDPSWLHYYHCITLAGGRPVSVPLREENGFRLHPQDVEQAITERTRMLIVVTPHNPTGAVLREDDLATLSAIACKRNLLVLADEIYERLVYDSAKHFSIGRLPGMRQRTLTVNGFSKAYSMTGWRLGYVAGPREIMDVLIRVHQYTTVCATSFAQSGAVAAYRGPQEFVEDMRLEFAERRRLMLDHLERIPGVTCARPEGAFYAFPSIRAFGRPSEALAMHLLEDGLIATVPGSAFGTNGEGYLRLAYSNSRGKIEEAMERMQQSLARL